MKSAYLLTLSLTVDDADPLWDAAASLAMRSPGMTMEDVADTIGPRAAPVIEDCIAMLVQPERFKGCALKSLDIARQRTPKPAIHPAHPATPVRQYQPFDRLAACHTVPVASPLEISPLD